MRATVDLPDDLYQIARAVAHDQRITLSEAVGQLVRRGLGTPTGSGATTDPATGLAIIHVGRPITSDNVRSLDDDS